MNRHLRIRARRQCRSRRIAVATAAVLLTGCGAAQGHSVDGSSSPIPRSPESGTSAATSANSQATHTTPAPGSTLRPGQIVVPTPQPTLTPVGTRIVDTSYPSPAMHGRRNVVVMLPVGYSAASSRRYPVVVLLHGDPGSPLTFIELGDLEAAQTASGVAPFIGVLPNGNGPVLQRSWFVNLPSQKMGTSVAVDLRKWVTASYRTNGSYSYAGLSSGGFAAAYMPLLDSQPIHAVCGLSGFYQGDIVPLMNASAAVRRQDSATAHLNREPAFTFLAYGSTDERTGPRTRSYAAALRAAHKRYELMTYPGGHGWVVWRPAFKQCLRLIVPSR